MLVQTRRVHRFKLEMVLYLKNCFSFLNIEGDYVI